MGKSATRGGGRAGLRPAPCYAGREASERGWKLWRKRGRMAGVALNGGGSGVVGLLAVVESVGVVALWRFRGSAGRCAVLKA